MKKIWIDIDNSPHVPFFSPISIELSRRGYKLVLTARNAYQVKELMQVYGMKAQIIGRHYGKNKLAKIMGCLHRALQLAPIIIRERPDAAISHGSRSMLFLSKILNIPLITLFDYEYGQTIPFIKPDLLIAPEIVTNIPFYSTNVLKYRGIKEDVYVPFFKPINSLKLDLNIDDNFIIVTIRPPATQAHYHNSESEILFHKVIRFLSAREDVKMIILPRNDKQAEDIREEWREIYKVGKIIIPLHALDGLNILWNSDLVISGGGTMNREATALGVPVYSIFRGKMGAVDLFLQREGKLVFIENTNDISEKVLLRKRQKTQPLLSANNTAFHQIISYIILFLEKPVEIKNYNIHDVQFQRHRFFKLKHKNAP